MSDFYNYTEFGSANSFDIRQPPSKLQNAGGIRANIGGPMTDRPMQPNGINNGFASETNVSVKATVRTRTRDQRYINQHQLGFIFTGNFDKPVMMSIQQINLLLAGGNPMTERNDRELFGERGQPWDPTNWTKEEICENFKLFGAVVNRDVDTKEEIRVDRVARAFTICVRGDAHVLDYWSTKDRELKRYDMCYFVLKKVWVDENTRFQSSLQARNHNVGVKPLNIGKGKYCWQILPYSCKDCSIPPSVYTSEVCREQDKIITDANGTRIKKGKYVAPGTKDALHEKVIGTYWQVGFTHEYATIGNSSMYQKRVTDHYLARDISYLHDNGLVRPIQMYLCFDDDTKFI